jgi:hypothetical protein
MTLLVPKQIGRLYFDIQSLVVITPSSEERIRVERSSK